MYDIFYFSCNKYNGNIECWSFIKKIPMSFNDFLGSFGFQTLGIGEIKLYPLNKIDDGKGNDIYLKSKLFIVIGLIHARYK